MLENEPLWYKDAIIYQLHVRAYCDRVGDGMGDFRGLTEKLDYLQDLGVSAIWILPFYPSPLRDDGYDIAEYTNVHADYGTLADFEMFLSAAHERGLRVITELVLNHTSDQHPWFQRARNAPPNDPHRDFYVWSDTPEKYQDARIIFKDFEPSNWTWDPVAKSYFWHRFYSHQPDLNYDNPEVRQAIFPVVDFWLGMGVDGMRLDAVPYLFEREGTTCENLPETHEFLKALRRHVDERFPNRMLLGEANQWPEDAVAYFGNGDEGHVAFHFPLMPRLFMAVHMEDRFPILDIMEQTPTIPDTCQWALFLRNHDELTLEMVTDEERDYMFRAYANDPRARINQGIRRRLAPLLGNNRRKIELMNGLLFSMPGTPVIYYGDEIGMGDNIYLGDRNSVRTPMQWSADRNAGFSRANPQKLFLPVIIDPEYHFEALNVEAQQNNPSSLLWWTKRLIGLRKQYRAFGRGSLEFLYPANRKVLAFVRRYLEECILVVANLSRFVQYVELDLSAFRGQIPVELFGRLPFPPVGQQPYFLTLPPHGFYWFELEPARAVQVGTPTVPTQISTIALGANKWESLFVEPNNANLEVVLPGHLGRCDWFAGKTREIRSATLQEAVRFPYRDSVAYLTQTLVEYVQAGPETYILPMALATGEQAERLLNELPRHVIARLGGDTAGVLFDGLADPNFCTAVLDAIVVGEKMPGSTGEIVAWSTPEMKQIQVESGVALTPTIHKSEQNNTSVIFGAQFVMKVFRRLELGVNPELELGQFLTERSFPHAAPLVGAVEYRRRKAEPSTIAVVHKFIPNEGDAWSYTLDALSSFFERVLALRADENPELPEGSLIGLAGQEMTPAVSMLIDTYAESVKLLGRRTAELHLALSSETRDPRFAPEPFSMHYQRSIYQSMRNTTAHSLQLLGDRIDMLPEGLKPDAHKLLRGEEDILRKFRAVVERKIDALRTRHHGDYHLGQVLFTGKDFVIIDFEGYPARSIGDRRTKRSPLRDVASMVWSFYFAAISALYGLSTARGRPRGVIRPEDIPVLKPWAQSWHKWVSAAFIRSYLDVSKSGSFLSVSRDEFEQLFDAFFLEKALVELGNDLIARPDSVRIPLQAVLEMTKSE